MDYSSLYAFLLPAAALAFVPGPTVTVIIANSLKHGTRAGLGNVLGTQVGVIIWLFVAAVALGTAMAVMGEWFNIFRYAGAAYLAWMAYKLFVSKGDLAVATQRSRPGGSFFMQGFVVIMLNPKMLVLFGTLIPPFIPQGADVFKYTMIMGLIFMALAAAGDTTYALLAGRAGAFLSQKRIRGIEIVSGCCLLAGAAWMVLKGH